jgi:hypothetical protein
VTKRPDLPCWTLRRCKIMEEFDGLRAVKEACLQLYIEVKQARVRAERTGTKLHEQLSDPRSLSVVPLFQEGLDWPLRRAARRR